MLSNNSNKKRVALGLSGGVDSSVAAYLLKKQGFDVTSVYMQCWDSKADGCRAEEDRASAVSVASFLDIKFEFLDFINAYKNTVIEYFYREYKLGRTPNPDILCNREIKFGLFMDWAMKNGFDYVATGHYARIQTAHDKYDLLKGIDNTKDQSYFLYTLKEHQLSKILFPLGDMHKSEVRKIAKEANLPTYNRPDSMGICFIGEVDIKDFLRKQIPETPGNIITKDGEVVGTHIGIAFYTIGQRHGFTLTKYFGLPMYVTGKNVERNELIVGYAQDVLGSQFNVSSLTWVHGHLPQDLKNISVRVRHLGEMYVCRSLTEGSVSRDCRSRSRPTLTEDEIVLNVEVTSPIFGIAPGQSAVFYRDDVLLGGGVIC